MVHVFDLLTIHWSSLILEWREYIAGFVYVAGIQQSQPFILYFLETTTE
jgi:hypothetical protein